MRALFCLGSKRLLTSVFLAAIFCGLSPAQQSLIQEPVKNSGVEQIAPRPPLITGAIDESKLTRLKGNTHPLARPEFDLGTAPATLPMERMLLVLKRSPDQEFALRKLLDDQQDKGSPRYHKWMTPEQFGKQFGPNDTDIQTISGWLQSHGFQVGTTKGRTVLEFSGSASQVQQAFHTTIHKYIVNEEQHWANASDPSIPSALTPAVAGVLTLHNFLKRPQIRLAEQTALARIVPGKKPQVTFPAQNGQPITHALSPQDYATIYNINPTYQNGITGSGVTIAVVGRSDPYNGGEDVSDFRSNAFSLCCGSFNILWNGPDPGDLGGGEEAEATLDSTWSGAIADNAYVELVVSATTNTTDGIDLSEAYIVENNFADIMTESFSGCELLATDSQLAFSFGLAEQAAAQGISYFVSSGDDGSEGCDDPSTAPATNPISVSLLASTPFNVAVGGTMFNENGDDAAYWGSEPPVQESAIKYIPENVWNESGATLGLWSSSGGASAGNVAAGGTTPGIPKPAWQSGVTGIPADGVRDVPDVSLTAAIHDAYLLCLEGSCVPNSQGYIYVSFAGGTSASAPSFAGIMGLVDQQMGGRQGQPNYVLYQLAAQQSAYPSQCNGSNATTPPASTCIFNDVTVGNNVVPGEQGTQYQAGAGYDLTTGLGSVNVANLVTNWTNVAFRSTNTIFSYSPNTVTHGSPVNISVTVTPGSGSGTPTGDIALLGGQSGQSSLGLFTLNAGSVSSTINSLPGGSYSLQARYPGDITFAPSTSTASPYITVTAEPSKTKLSVLTFDNKGNQSNFTGGPFGSFVYLRADVAGNSGVGIPTGSVTFLDSGNPISAATGLPLNSLGNTATPNGILNFDTGTHSISASYSGDPSFNANNTVPPPITFAITPGFFIAMPSNQPTVQISAPGSSGSISLAVATSTGFTGTITLACFGLPAGAACQFAPASITATGTAATTTSTITVTTTGTAVAMLHPPTRQPLPRWLALSGLAIFSIVVMNIPYRRRSSLLLLTILAVIIVAPGCGGGGGNSGSSTQTPPPKPATVAGAYTITVNASSGTATSSTSFTLFVQ